MTNKPVKAVKAWAIRIKEAMLPTKTIDLTKETVKLSHTTAVTIGHMCAREAEVKKLSYRSYRALIDEVTMGFVRDLLDRVLDAQQELAIQISKRIKEKRLGTNQG